MFFPVLSTTSPPSRFRSPSSSLPQVGSPYFSAWQWCRGVVLVLAQVGNGEPFIHRKYIGKQKPLSTAKNSSQQADLIATYHLPLKLVQEFSPVARDKQSWLVLFRLPSSPIISHPNNSLGFSGCIWCQLGITYSGGCNMAVFLLHMLRRPGGSRIMDTSWN